RRRRSAARGDRAVRRCRRRRARDPGRRRIRQPRSGLRGRAGAELARASARRPDRRDPLEAAAAGGRGRVLSAAGKADAAREATPAGHRPSRTRDFRSSLAIYRRLLGYTRPYRAGFVVALVAMIVAAATEPLFPALMKPLLDEGFVYRSGFPLWFVPAALIAIFVVRGIATFTSSYALAWVANGVLVDIRTQMFDRVLRLPSEQFEREASGLLISRIVFEVTNVTAAVTRALTVLVRDTIVILGLVGWLLYLNWKLTLVALMLIPAMTVVVSVYSRRMRKLSRQSLQY